jgi:sulfite exporter TauE/SafE
MGLGTSIFMIAAGAILAFAVNVTTQGVNLQTVGWILMIVGAIGLVLSFAFWNSWGGIGYRRRTVVQQPGSGVITQRDEQYQA